MFVRLIYRVAHSMLQFVRVSWGFDFWKLHVRRFVGSPPQEMLDISEKKKTPKCEIFLHMYFDKKWEINGI